MIALGDLAKILRSKNAGPLFVTFDIMFENSKDYFAVKNSSAINKKEISDLYDMNEDGVQVIYYDAVNAVKVTIPRKNVSGSRFDRDIYGCQQHVPLTKIELNDSAIEMLKGKV